MNLDSGRHVAINIRTKTPLNLDHIPHVEQLFHDTISAISMNPLTSPESHLITTSMENVKDPTADDGGLTTFCIIDTSHIAYHSWPLQRRFRFTVDSCKDFSVDKVLHVLHKFFDIEGISVVEAKYVPPMNIHPTTTGTVQLHLLPKDSQIFPIKPSLRN